MLSKSTNSSAPTPAAALSSASPSDSGVPPQVVMKYSYVAYNQAITIRPQLADELRAVIFSIPWGLL